MKRFLAGLLLALLVFSAVPVLADGPHADPNGNKSGAGANPLGTPVLTVPTEPGTGVGTDQGIGADPNGIKTGSCIDPNGRCKSPYRIVRSEVFAALLRIFHFD